MANGDPPDQSRRVKRLQSISIGNECLQHEFQASFQRRHCNGETVMSMSLVEGSAPAVPAMRQRRVQCISPSGLHGMAYTEWGDPANPRVLVCVHGLTRSGRDFDEVAKVMAREYRVICPDVAGRGLSDWLADPKGYGIPQYVSDMVALIARLNVETVDWFGTSMGGLIGLGLAGLPDSPIAKLLLNDVGPHIEPIALERIGAYLGRDISFASLEEGIDNAAELAATFGPLTSDEWRAINTPLLHEREGALGLSIRPEGRDSIQGRDPGSRCARRSHVVACVGHDPASCVGGSR